MSSETSQVSTSGSRNRSREQSRRRAARTSALRWLSLDVLEPRALLATIPAPVAGLNPVDVSNSQGNESAPSIAVDANNPLRMVSAWVRNDPTLAPSQTEVVEFATSNDGGKTWINQGRPGNFLIDPTSSRTSITRFPQATNTTVGFDRNDNFYILYSQHTPDKAVGALVLSKYNFSTGTPTTVFQNKVVYWWVVVDPALNPTLAIDDSVATFTDTDSNGVTRTQSDPNSGNVYVAWTSQDAAPASGPNNFNPYRIPMVVSSDGGRTFSGIKAMNDGGNFGAGRNDSPRVVVSQGAAPRPAGTNGPSDPGSPGINPGAVTVVWDDFGLGARANPPYDVITSSHIGDGAFATTAAGQTGPIDDAIKGVGSTDTPVSTDFPINVNITDPRFTTVSNVAFNLAIQHPALAELSAVLIPPTGSGLQPITLFRNQNDASNNANTAIGISGADLGIAPSGMPIGTTFDDYAARNIVDINQAGTRGAAAPYVGHFRPETGSLDGRYDGATAAQVNGQWTLRITDFRNGNVGAVQVSDLTFTSHYTKSVTTQVTTVLTHALLSGTQTASAAVAQGIAPTPVIASDNTLGAYSPYQGRLYVAYADRLNLLNNPADNTNIYMSYSDDGGVTWTRNALPLDHDNAQTDGFSEGSSAGTTRQNTGRPQFQPNLAVDPVTGTLVASWLDTRNDADRARVTTYLTTSIDGGQTFSPDVYANSSQFATDAITGAKVNLGPIPDNQSGTSAEPVAGFGEHQGLAVYGGIAHPAWSSNLNGGNASGTPLALDIRTNAVTFAAGPRVVSTTMGPIGLPGDAVNSDRAADGTPIASTFLVTFDRPVDPATFQTSDVRVRYRDTTVGNVTGGFVPVTSVTPLDLGLLGATHFQVDFAPRTGVGTYSLEITSAEIQDRIRTIRSTVAPVGGAVNVSSSNVPILIAPSSTIDSTVTVGSFPATRVVAGVTVTVSISAADASSLTLTLISPTGTRVLLASREPFPFAGGQDYSGTTFSDNGANSINQGTAPFTGTFVPLSPLKQFIGQGLNGTWTLEVTSSQTPTTASLTSWSLGLTAGTQTTATSTGNLMDQNANANPGQGVDFYAAPMPVTPSSGPFTGPFVQDTLPLILPGPRVASTSIPGQPASSDNVVLDTAVNAIDVVFDRDMSPATVTPATVLRVMGPAGAIAGPYTILANPLGSDPDASHPRTYRVGFPTQTLSGTYTVTLASTIADSHGNALDENMNAGIDLLRQAVSGPTTPVTYNATTTPVPLPAGRTVTSSLTIPDNFLVQGLTVTLDITEPNDPDLQITLVSPGNIPIVLVARGTGATGTHANFSGTIFDDATTTPIANGGPPFFGRFQPNQPLSSVNGAQAQGTWRLVIDGNPSNSSAAAGRLNSWSLSFQKGVSSTGLGETVADQATASFRIFNLAPTNPLAGTTWTAVGPASAGNTTATKNGYTGRVGSVAVDPSDPSGNTVYVAGASGGVWKTTNFLTTDPNGPTYIPLTDYGPNSALDIGSIAVFPRNNDPKQTIIIAGTGEGNTTYNSFGSVGGNTSRGVGFIRSVNGGATWALLDSTNNNLPFASRDHLFGQGNFFGLSTSTMKVVMDPHLTPDGGVIVYAALKAPFASNNGGLWRSVDTGLTWTKLSDNSLGGASDVILDYNSATVDAVSNPTGNVNIIYAAFPGSGVYISPNRGQVLNKMAGGNVDPLIVDTITQRQVPVNNNATPTGFPGDGRIVLAKPTVLASSVARSDVENTLYEGWLYAAVADPFGHLDGIYMTKDNGQTWTKVQIYGLPDLGFVPRRSVPTNDGFTNPNYDVLGSTIYAHGNYDLALAVDPTNPNVIYMGGTVDGNESGLIRVDTTGIYDSHAAVSYNGNYFDVGSPLQISTTGRAQVDDPQYGPSQFVGTSGEFGAAGPYINLVSDPTQPFSTNATVFVRNVAAFTNTGAGVKWTTIDEMLQADANSAVPSSNVHSITTLVDPLTGHARLIVSDDQGVFTAVLNADGSINHGIGTATAPAYSRNGNLQLAQLYYGSSQPSNTALSGQLSALLYGNGINVGTTESDPNILTNGNVTGQTSTDGDVLGVISITSGDKNGTGIGVDQQGRNIVYRYEWPEFGGNKTDFMQVSLDGGQTWISRTTGLVQTANDPQWPGQSPTYPNNNALPGAGAIALGNFAVNPLNGDQLMISSNAGRVFATTNQGRFWLSIGEPGSLDGTYVDALTFGAPDPNGPGGVGNLNNFLYAGTVGGKIFVSQTGGGGANNSWTDTSTGLDGSPVVKIIADPTRGSHDAYAVTQAGVFYNPDTTLPGSSWTDITNNLFQLTTSPFGNTQQAQPALSYLTSIQADWRYAIPNSAANGGGTFPVLYVSGNGGVFRSIDNGTTWSAYPSVAFDGSPVDGGYLPVANVTDLTVALGKIDPTTGRAVAVPGDPNLLVATTFGRGQFAIRLAPIVFPANVALDPKLPAPGGSAGGGTATDPATGKVLPVVNVAQPVFDGLSEQTAFGNKVRITILDLTNPSSPKIIGGYDPSNPASDVAANQTDSAGNFAVQVNPTGFSSNGTKTIGIQATDASGTQGNIVTFQFILKAQLITAKPPAMPTIRLNPADDTSGGFNITRNTSPRIIGVTDPGAVVQLFLAGGTALGTAVADSTGAYSIAFPTQSPTDGTFTVKAVATNSYGSTTSANFTFQIRTVGPTATPTFDLLPADDSGIVGDKITSVRLPHFVGSTDPFAKISIYKLDESLNPVGQALNQVNADASGYYSIQLPYSLLDGRILLKVQESDAAGNLGNFSKAIALNVVTVDGDYTGTGKTTPAIFRRQPDGSASWFIQGVSPQAGIPFGGGNVDVPFTGDFDGNGISDLAVYRPGTNTWFINRDRLGFETFSLGLTGTVPVVGNFDGGGVTEVGAYDPSAGVWTILGTSNGTRTYNPTPGGFVPQSGDVPAPGDYGGRGYDQLAVYRPSNSTFYVMTPSSVSPPRFTLSTFAVQTAAGEVGDVPVPGQYDNTVGYHKTEAAVFNPTTGVWTVLGPAGTPTSTTFNPGDIPVPGDWNGSGKTQEAVYRPSIASFLFPSGPTAQVPFGSPGDIPVDSPLIYRNIVATTPTLYLEPQSDTGIVGDGITSARRPVLRGATDPNTLIDLVDTTGRVIGSGSSDSAGLYRIQLSPNADLPNGVYTVTARAHGIVSTQGPMSRPVTIRLVTVDGDYTGAGHAIPAIFRRTNNLTGQWFVLNTPGLNGVSFGAGGYDVPLSGDFTGAGKTDLAFYRPGTQAWYIATPANKYGGQLLTNFGGVGDIPVPANYTGSGVTTVAVYRPGTGQWFIQGQSQPTTVAAGLSGDVPVPGNYDNTGQDELAIFRPGTAPRWIVNGPNGAYTILFGGSGDVPVPGNYDATAANQATRPAIWRPGTGTFFVRTPSGGTRTVKFSVGDIPIPADYDGIGMTEPAVYRPSTGQIFVVGPNDASPRLLGALGGGVQDIPPISPYRYRAVSGGGPGVTAQSVIGSGGVLDLGSSARSMSTGSAASTTTPAAPPTTVRHRPLQAPHAKANHHTLLSLRKHVTVKKGPSNLG